MVFDLVCITRDVEHRSDMSVLIETDGVNKLGDNFPLLVDFKSALLKRLIDLTMLAVLSDFAGLPTRSLSSEYLRIFFTFENSSGSAFVLTKPRVLMRRA